MAMKYVRRYKGRQGVEECTLTELYTYLEKHVDDVDSMINDMVKSAKIGYPTKYTVGSLEYWVETA